MILKPSIISKNLAVVLNGKPVLENISFEILPGELAGIIGPNGAGKTTLLRAILGLVPLHSGELQLLGSPVNQIKKLRAKIGYMPQRLLFERQFPLSVADVVATGLLTSATLLRRVNGASKMVTDTLDSVGMKHYISRPFQDLSGGEQQRVLLARALIRKPALLLLDESNTGLDFPAQQRFLDLLNHLQKKRKLTIILVSHDLVSVAAVADKLICINRIMHVHGHPSDVLHSPSLQEAYRCEYDFLSTTTKIEGEQL